MSENNDATQQQEDRPVDEETAVQGEVIGEDPPAAPAGEPREVPAAGADDDSEAEHLRQELESARQRESDALDKAMRARAEMENLQKRTARDVEQAHKYALEKFVNELLPVIDSLELGLDAADAAADLDSVREGMQLTLKKFQDVLGKFGVTAIDPQGEKFNPEYHEAVSTQELEGYESGLVTSVMQKGYELNGRLVRPAMVIVAK